MTYAFEHKVALVTGAGSGIGRASALLFAQAHASVVVADMNVAHGQETARQITALGGKALFVQADVSNATEVERLVALTVATYGGLDYAHNNAGIEGPQVSTADCSEAEWQRTLAVNLTSVWLCMKHEIPAMQRRGGGAIVNTSSVAGLRGVRHASAYTASKHGVVGLTKAAALDVAEMNIRVNAVCPGLTATAMVDRLSQLQPEIMAMVSKTIPIGKTAAPLDIAQAVLWLCSDAAAYVTGHAMSVDGGITAQ
jgi:NAD(P)-dependent dehydrogenase (short-subunit alcohol dehydrogenase family)